MLLATMERAIAESAERTARELRAQGGTEDSISEHMDIYIESACRSLYEHLDANVQTALDEIRKQLAN